MAKLSKRKLRGRKKETGGATFFSLARALPRKKWLTKKEGGRRAGGNTCTQPVTDPGTGRADEQTIVDKKIGNVLNK